MHRVNIGIRITTKRTMSIYRNIRIVNISSIRNNITISISRIKTITFGVRNDSPPSSRTTRGSSGTRVGNRSGVLSSEINHG
ncbi:hypothetical protein HanIR_Chr15g0730611 [Helianthus annuus]|nr:hypothetical protein HanIR_Chr15g0730611 [Helianthus annuus]